MRTMPVSSAGLALVLLVAGGSAAHADVNVHVQNCIAGAASTEYVAAADDLGIVGKQGTKVSIPYESEVDLKCDDSTDSGACFVKVHGANEYNLIDSGDVTFYGEHSYTKGVIDTDCSQSPSQ